MKNNITALFRLFILINILILALLSMPEQASAEENSAIWKHQATGDFAGMVDKIKTGLEGAQFLISSEENLAKGLANNKHILGRE